MIIKNLVLKIIGMLCMLKFISKKKKIYYLIIQKKKEKIKNDLKLIKII